MLTNASRAVSAAAAARPSPRPPERADMLPPQQPPREIVKERVRYGRFLGTGEACSGVLEVCRVLSIQVLTESEAGVHSGRH